MTRSETIEAELASLWRVFLAEETTSDERCALQEKIDPLRAEFQTLNADAIAAAQVEFATNKPNPPEHADFMGRAAERYPTLPPGAQQNALHCLETLGKPAAQRYARNAAGRHQQSERDLMGTTLSAWRKKRSDEVAPYHFEGVMPAARRKEILANVARNAEYFYQGRAAHERQMAQERKKSERKLAKALAAVEKPTTVRPAPAKVDSDLVARLVEVFKSAMGATYAEAAKALGIEPKGDRPHQTPAAQVRALVRDKVRQLHEIVAADYDRARGGAVFRLQ